MLTPYQLETQTTLNKVKYMLKSSVDFQAFFYLGGRSSNHPQRTQRLWDKPMSRSKTAGRVKHFIRRRTTLQYHRKAKKVPQLKSKKVLLLTSILVIADPTAKLTQHYGNHLQYSKHLEQQSEHVRRYSHQVQNTSQLYIGGSNPLKIDLSQMYFWSHIRYPTLLLCSKTIQQKLLVYKQAWYAINCDCN